MTSKELIIKKNEYCQGRLEKLQEKCLHLPEGRIGCFEQNGFCYWRVTDKDGKRRYLRRSERETVKKLVQRRLYEAEIKDLKCEIECCKRYLRYEEKCGGHVDRLLSESGEAFKNLTAELYRTEDERIKAWERASYNKSLNHPETLKILTSQKFRVRSKSEALISEALFQLKIPARYEEMHTFGQDTFATDFTILNPVTLSVQYIEYFGMMDSAEYVDSYLYKTAVYTKHELIPDIDILYFYETRESKIDMDYIRMRLENFVFGGAFI